MIIFFMLMQFRRIYEFKAQHRWLSAHPEVWVLLNLETIPHRTTLSRQYKRLATVVTEFVAFVGNQVSDLDEAFANTHLAEDKSLFKANGPVWHQSDRQEGRIPPKLRHLDTDATWGKSGYQGWVYGYSIHITCTESAFPKMVQTETAAVADNDVLDQKADFILKQLHLATLHLMTVTPKPCGFVVGLAEVSCLSHPPCAGSTAVTPTLIINYWFNLIFNNALESEKRVLNPFSTWLPK